MWNSVSCNILYKKYIQKKQDEYLSKHIKGMRPVIDTKPPKSMQHKLNFAKRKTAKLLKDEQIDYENDLLLKKMLEIDFKPKPLSTILIAVSPKNRTSLNLPYRIRKMSQINSENQRLFSRINKMRSQYSTKEWEKSNDYLNYIKSNISKNSGRFEEMRPSTVLSANKSQKVFRPDTRSIYL